MKITHPNEVQLKTREEILAHLQNALIKNLYSAPGESKLAQLIIDRLSNGETSLNLAQCDITPTALAPLVYVLSHDTNVTELNLCYNHLGDDGAKQLGGTLTTNHTLKHLHLLYNQLSDEGIGYLTEALKLNHTLQSLDLSSNHDISPVGIAAIGDMLKENQGLIKLCLYRSNIDNDAVKSITEGLSQNRSLAELDLGENHIDDTGCGYLKDMLATNFTLIKLSLYTNPIPEHSEPYVAIEKAIQRNNALYKTISQSMLSATHIPGAWIFKEVMQVIAHNHGIFPDVQGLVLEKMMRVTWQEKVETDAPGCTVETLPKAIQDAALTAIPHAANNWTKKLQEKSAQPTEMPQQAR